MINTLVVFIVGTIWGSFLNCFSYRILRGIGLGRNSFCPVCKNPIAWYDLIPIISWCNLGGHCRTCTQPISFLYPFIELLTGALWVFLYWLVPAHYWLGYGIFTSALIVTIRSDAECMLISRAVTLYLLPLMFLLSLNDLLPIPLWQSLAGASGGYLFMWTVASVFHWTTGQEGMGQGDIDLLAFIGSAIGIIGCWASILVGSLSGCIAACVLYATQPANPDNESLKIPFGVFLAAGAITYVLHEPHFTRLLHQFS